MVAWIALTDVTAEGIIVGAFSRVSLASMNARRFSGLILDFAGVLTSNMVDVITRFEERERLPRGTFLRGWADPRGAELYHRLEVGEIDQTGWNEGFGALLGINPDNLMGRLLYELDPACEAIRAAREARAAAIRTAVLTNSLGRHPHDPLLAETESAMKDLHAAQRELGMLEERESEVNRTQSPATDLRAQLTQAEAEFAHLNNARE